MLIVACGSLFLFIIHWCLLFIVRCAWIGVNCLLFAVCRWSVFVVCVGLLFVVCYVLLVACRSLFIVACCLLFVVL